ncbi:hypothetical protein DL96DRAFT_1609269 [Flagelloscypha sp. PMI_526]|nr:hypothetical protein DL96DRAFT_1609269 [Flagelloscypha sp. PMI_526]
MRLTAMVQERDSLSSSSSVMLPVELFRDILEILAWSEKARIPGLMLISRQVYQWLRPILYHSVTVGWSSRARPQDVRFYRTHMDPGRSSLLRPSSSSNHVLEDVKYLTLHPLYELAPHTLFAPFPSTTKLAFWLPDCQCCESRTMNALLSLPNLREICFGHPKSFGTFVSNLTRKCVRLTHIVAFNTPWSPWKISQFPALTHLMLTLDMLVEDVDCVTALRELLAGGGRDDDGPEFQLLVLLARARSDVKHGWDMLEKCGLTDWRVIVVQRTWDTKKAWEGDADSFWDWLGETWNEGRRLRDSRRACTS